MPPNPDKRRCLYPGCQAWARRDADEAYCATHARLVLDQPPAGTLPVESPAPDAAQAADPPKAARGGQPGTQNRLFHGFYRRTLDEEEVGDLARCDKLDNPLYDDLVAEVLVARVALRRTLDMLAGGATLGEDPRPLEREEVLRLISLSFQGVRTIARLVAVQNKLGTDQRRRQSWGRILRQVSEDLKGEP